MIYFLQDIPTGGQTAKTKERTCSHAGCQVVPYEILPAHALRGGPGPPLEARPRKASERQRRRRRIHRLGPSAPQLRPGGVRPHQEGRRQDPERFPGAGGHRHRRVLPGRPGRHRLPVLPQLQLEKEEHPQRLFCRQRPVRRRPAGGPGPGGGRGLLRERHLQVRHHHGARRGLPLLPGGPGEEIRQGGRQGPHLRHHRQEPGRLEIPGGHRGLGDLRGARQCGRPLQRADRRGPAAHRRHRRGHRRPHAGRRPDDGPLRRALLRLPRLALRRRPLQCLPLLLPWWPPGRPRCAASSPSSPPRWQRPP